MITDHRICVCVLLAAAERLKLKRPIDGELYFFSASPFGAKSESAVVVSVVS